MKTHKHVIADERRFADEEKNEVNGLGFEVGGDRWFVEINIRLLLRNGNSLPDCYRGIESSFYDFYANLSWRAPNAAIQIKMILDDDRLSEIVKRWKENHGFDIEGELKAAYDEFDCDF